MQGYVRCCINNATNGVTLSQLDINTLFGNIQEIYEFNRLDDLIVFAITNINQPPVIYNI